LQEARGERWETLQKILKICEDEEINVLAICGDLFDKNPDIKDLRKAVQELFSDNEFDTLIIPGNHDAEVCGDMYFGDRGKLLSGSSRTKNYPETRFVGLPCKELRKEEVLDEIRRLRGTLSDDKTNILLYHGELLDAFYAGENYGEEEGRTMPVKLSYFRELPIGYVLAGHFHTNFSIWQMDNGGFFVYSGSPIPIKRKETGKRKVNIFEVGKPPSPRTLDVPFYQPIDLTLDPIENENPLKEIEERVEHVDPNAIVLLTVDAYINSEKIGLSETEFAEQVKKIAKKRTTEGPKIKVRDISRILEHDLFRDFMEKLEQLNFAEEKERQLRNIAIRAMMRANL